MQEEVENKTLTLAITTTKMTGRVLKNAIAKYLAYRKNKSREGPVKPKGKQTVKELVGQGEGTSSIEVSDPSIRDFDRIARKYGVDYAVKKDRGASPPKYLVFFKARDTDALNAAFTEYSTKKIRKASRPSVLKRLAHFKELVKHAVPERTRRKERER